MSDVLEPGTKFFIVKEEDVEFTGVESENVEDPALPAFHPAYLPRLIVANNEVELGSILNYSQSTPDFIYEIEVKKVIMPRLELKLDIRKTQEERQIEIAERNAKKTPAPKKKAIGKTKEKKATGKIKAKKTKKSVTKRR